jgi:hypothetical protein
MDPVEIGEDRVPAKQRRACLAGVRAQLGEVDKDAEGSLCARRT